MILQKTLKKPIEISGIGLHSGQTVTMQLLPAPANTGITFVRSDLRPIKKVRACPTKVTETTLCTVLSDEGVSIATVEHILAALAGLGVDNVEIVVDAPEIPIVDGSASPFVYALQQAGLKTQDAEKQFLFIRDEVEVRVEDKWAKLSPFDKGFKIDFAIDFSHPAIRKTNNRLSLTLTSQRFIQELSRARTFGFLRDSEYLRQNNLALGGSLDNAVVLDEYRVLNAHGLRYDDEFVRHKALDAIGDLYIGGHAIVGHYMGYKSGHALNNELYRAVLANKNAYEIKGFSEAEAQSLQDGKWLYDETNASEWVF